MNEEERIMKEMEGLLMLYEGLREKAGLEKRIDMAVLGKIAEESNDYVQKNIDNIDNGLEILDKVWEIVEDSADEFRRGYYSLLAVGFLDSIGIRPTDASVFEYVISGFGSKERLKEWLSKEEKPVLESNDGGVTEDFAMLIVLKYIADKYVEVIE